jgi:hypothetical protein
MRGRGPRREKGSRGPRRGAIKPAQPGYLLIPARALYSGPAGYKYVGLGSSIRPSFYIPARLSNIPAWHCLLAF